MVGGVPGRVLVRNAPWILLVAQSCVEERVESLHQLGGPIGFLKASREISGPCAGLRCLLVFAPTHEENRQFGFELREPTQNRFRAPLCGGNIEQDGRDVASRFLQHFDGPRRILCGQDVESKPSKQAFADDTGRVFAVNEQDRSSPYRRGASGAGSRAPSAPE